LIASHLEDYNEPIKGIIPLCNLCHLMVHTRESKPKRWRLYVELVEMRGCTFAPQEVSWEAFNARWANGNPIPEREEGPRKDRILSLIGSGVLNPNREPEPTQGDLW
jgi:hypothetical protein